METKNSIRQNILSLRNSCSRIERENKSREVTQNALSFLQSRQAEYILCYAAYQSEAETSTFMEQCLSMGKKLYLPKVSGMEMDFYRIQSLSDLKPGYKKIPEPDGNYASLFTDKLWQKQKEKTVMFLPGAAFSRSGVRIGYGMGYYDRYLMRIPCIERTAFCFDMQIVDYIPADKHDIPVTTIITESGIYPVAADNGSIRNDIR